MNTVYFNINSFPWMNLLPDLVEIDEQHPQLYLFKFNSFRPWTMHISKSIAAMSSPTAIMKAVRAEYKRVYMANFGHSPWPDDEDTFVIEDITEDDEPEWPKFAVSKGLQNEPKNNDGRTHCYWCGDKTEKRGSMGEYDLCPKCQK